MTVDTDTYDDIIDAFTTLKLALLEAYPRDTEKQKALRLIVDRAFLGSNALNYVTLVRKIQASQAIDRAAEFA